MFCLFRIHLLCTHRCTHYDLLYSARLFVTTAVAVVVTKAGGVISLKPTAVVVVVTEAGVSGLSKRFDGGGTT